MYVVGVRARWLPILFGPDSLGSASSQFHIMCSKIKDTAPEIITTPWLRAKSEIDAVRRQQYQHSSLFSLIE